MLLLAAITFLAVLPFVWTGIPSGHDFEFHLFSWMDVVSQWHQGVVYPRWAALAHWGYGEARFLFYPPASWTLGAALGAILPWKLVPAAYCWIALTLAGFSMYHMARHWLPAPDALFAAAFYALNPYHLVVVYWRSAFAELLAAALLPLLLVSLLKLREPGARPVLSLALVLAAAWLTNAPSALMIHYSAAGLVVFLAFHERSWRPLVRLASAVLLGIGVASFYLLPAIYEERWINIAEVLGPGVRPQDNFLFTTIADADHNRFNLLISSLALAEIALFAIVIWRSRAARATNRTLWLLASIWGTATAWLMFSVSYPLWQVLPKFRFVQLPFRWLLCLNAALALLLAMSARRWTTRALASALMLAVVLIAAFRIQTPWWDTAADIREMSDAMSDGTGNEGIDEYVPLGDDPYELNKDQSPVMSSSGAPLPAQIIRWDAEDRRFIVHTSAPEVLTVHLFDYPAWKTTVNGAPVSTRKSDVTGLLLVPVAAGQSEVQIRFIRTGDRLLGGIVSLLALLVAIVIWIKTRTHRISTNHMPSSPVLIATSNPGKLRDFAGAAAAHGITVAGLPGFSSLPPVIEDGATFEANARKKAEAYSLAVPGELVLADDSGLEIDALGGAPGVHSARYSADEPYKAESNTEDEANNARVLRELIDVPPEKRTARFVCVIAAARDGQTLQTFRGACDGIILDAPRGRNGFGYDPLFFFPAIQKTFAELSAEEKSKYSHRGAALRAFLTWYRTR